MLIYLEKIKQLSGLNFGLYDIWKLTENLISDVNKKNLFLKTQNDRD